MQAKLYQYDAYSVLINNRTLKHFTASMIAGRQIIQSLKTREHRRCMGKSRRRYHAIKYRQIIQYPDLRGIQDLLRKFKKLEFHQQHVNIDTIN